EWRTFGPGFGKAEAALLAKRTGADQESDELYFLSDHGENVKVRSDLMDIKVLKETNPDGLEQWMPVMKASFPLPSAEVAKVLEALHVGGASAKKPTYTLDEFVEAFAKGPGAKIRAVKVHKLRRRATVGTCMAELSDVTVEGRTTRTLAI